jgi:DNA-binding HxlR family transcriptional regulator
MTHATPPLEFNDLFRYRWTLPILIELDRAQGARFVVLATRLGVSRDVLQSTLVWMIDEGLATHNPGYGHPLRPEYLPTPLASRIAPAAGRLLATAKRADCEALVLPKWNLPALDALRGGPQRFSEVQAALPGVTPRALTIALRQLIEGGLVARAVGEGFPPTTHYSAHGAAARGLLRTMAELRRAFDAPQR